MSSHTNCSQKWVGYSNNDRLRLFWTSDSQSLSVRQIISSRIIGRPAHLNNGVTNIGIALFVLYCNRLRYGRNWFRRVAGVGRVLTIVDFNSVPHSAENRILMHMYLLPTSYCTCTYLLLPTVVLYLLGLPTYHHFFGNFHRYIFFISGSVFRSTCSTVHVHNVQLWNETEISGLSDI